MPIAPERGSSRQEVRSAISSHFWETPLQSSRFLEGLAYSLPSEPQAVLPAPSGLSRTQQLLALQALSVPVIPAFDGAAGGMVSTQGPVELPAFSRIHYPDVCVLWLFARLCRSPSIA